MSGPEPPEVPDDTAPDLTAELTHIQAARIAKIRHRGRIRAAHRLARFIGVDLRNSAKLARIRKERGQQ